VHLAPTVCHRGRLARFPAPCLRSATFRPVHVQVHEVEPHCARFDAAAKSIANHKVETIAQLCDKRLQIEEVVTIVAVAYDNKAPPGRR
jgi:hypothetical protein